MSVVRRDTKGAPQWLQSEFQWKCGHNQGPQRLNRAENKGISNGEWLETWRCQMGTVVVFSTNPQTNHQ